MIVARLQSLSSVFQKKIKKNTNKKYRYRQGESLEAKKNIPTKHKKQVYI
jgi:hypothetical protein